LNKSYFERLGEQYKNQVYDSNGRFNHVDAEAVKYQLDEQSKQMEATQSKSHEDRDQLLKIQRHHLEQHAQDVETQTDALRKNHEQETSQLRSQLKTLAHSSKDLDKKKSEEIARSIKENENEWLMKERRLVDGFKNEMQKVRTEGERAEGRFSERNQAQLRDQERDYTGVIKESNVTHGKEMRRLEENFGNEIDRLAKQREKENQSISEATSNKLHDANVERDKALENQAKAYQESFNRYAKSSNDQIDSLQKELHKQKTSDDAGLIPVAAENAVRKSMIRHYEKVLAAEHERHDASENHMIRNNADTVRDLVQERQNSETAIHQENAATQSQDRSVFLATVHETELNKKDALARGEQDNARYVENLVRNYSLMMERQRRAFESNMTNFRNDAATRIHAERQEGEFKQRMTERALNQRQNEVVREYEKKLLDQKTENEFKVDELKTQAQHDYRELERDRKTALESQAKGYEQRIAQLEAQYKERERYSAQGYEDQLARVRRSHEIARQKKG
jgi:hypothetical protein